MPAQQLQRERTKANIRQKIFFTALCTFYRDKGRFKHSTKLIKDRLETFTHKFDNDGECAGKCSL